MDADAPSAPSWSSIHIQPYALGGPTSTENISLRCRRHNQYEAEVVFGPRNKGNAMC